jgi:hypothetical protein
VYLHHQVTTGIVEYFNRRKKNLQEKRKGENRENTYRAKKQEKKTGLTHTKWVANTSEP